MTLQAEAIAAGLAFIEGHLCQPITVGDIAGAAGYSLFHFIRTFNKIARHTPYDYLIRRRLSHAALLLLESGARLLDIAMTCQFDSHEGFTRAFNRLFGVPPSVWRDRRFLDRRFLMPPLQQEDLLFRQMADLKPPELVNFDKMVLVGWMTCIASESRHGAIDSAFFKRALSENAILGAGEVLWKVRILPTSQVQQEMGFLGVQTTAAWVSTDRFVIKIIQGGRFLRFSHPALANYREAARRYCYHTFIPKSGLRLAKPIELERLGEVDTLFLPVERNLE